MNIQTSIGNLFDQTADTYIVYLPTKYSWIHVWPRKHVVLVGFHHAPIDGFDLATLIDVFDHCRHARDRRHCQCTVDALLYVGVV